MMIPERIATFSFRKKLYEHMKLREGYKEDVYLDTLGKPTCGIGHLLTKKENELYEVGDVIDEKIISDWFEKDIKKALDACNEQCIKLEVFSKDFKIALTSVNFQLGVNWYKKFPSAWKALCEKRYEDAIAEITYKKRGKPEYSNWYKQTPVRVVDFCKAIEKLEEE